MGSFFGEFYKIATFGESHGVGVGVVIDGCPPGYEIQTDKIQEFLNRRRPGQSHLSSPRGEKDQVRCISGLQGNTTLGTPITLLVMNEDFKPDDYQDMDAVFRPSHADYTTFAKYGIKAPSGGGRASVRETIGRVAAAAVAEQVLHQRIDGFEVCAYVDTVKDVEANKVDLNAVTRKQVEEHPLRCPDVNAREKMEQLILKVKDQGDSVGGLIRCVIRGCPVGLGDPVFDKIEADLAKGMMSLPAAKGFDIGSGFDSITMYGSEHNDAFSMAGDKVKTTTNRSGGVQGGISNGENIYFRVAFKPVSTIFKEQDTVNSAGKEVKLKPKSGRHDPCVLPRAVPIVEAMALLVVMDRYLGQTLIEANRGPSPAS